MRRDLLKPPKPSSAPLRILVADDDPISSRILHKFVQSWGFEMVPAGNGAEAWPILRDARTRLALLDWEMPEIDGLELCRRVRAESKSNYTYIILLTSRDEQKDIVAGLEAGADDYMTKPVKFAELRARLRTGQRIVELEDILLENQKRLYALATRDGLTGLWNRRTTIQFLEAELAEGERRDSATSVIMMDIDHFKTINDTYGHLAGDKVLKTLAARLPDYLRPNDKIGRYGGDEFFVVLPNCTLANAAKIAERLRQSCVRRPARFNGNSLGFTMSIGVASSEWWRKPTTDRLIYAGDQGLYKAKRMGRDRISTAEPPAKPAGRKGARNALAKR